VDILFIHCDRSLHFDKRSLQLGRIILLLVPRRAVDEHSRRDHDRVDFREVIEDLIAICFGRVFRDQSFEARDTSMRHDWIMRAMSVIAKPRTPTSSVNESRDVK
jgi:hypothetical protein